MSTRKSAVLAMILIPCLGVALTPSSRDFFAHMGEAMAGERNNHDHPDGGEKDHGGKDHGGKDHDHGGKDHGHDHPPPPSPSSPPNTPQHNKPSAFVVSESGGCTQAAWHYAKYYDKINGGETMRKTAREGRWPVGICSMICSDPQEYGVNPQYCDNFLAYERRRQ